MGAQAGAGVRAHGRAREEIGREGGEGGEVGMNGDRQEKAKGNRERMPQFSAWLDRVRAAFGPGERVLYAREGGLEAGVRFEDRLVDGRVVT